MNTAELLAALADAWDWLVLHPDAPPALELVIANSLLNTLTCLLNELGRARYPTIAARLPFLYRCIECGDVETVRAWWQQARPLLLQEPAPNRRLC